MTDPINQEDISYFKSLNWKFKIWEPSPALVDKNGFASHQYVGQSFDSNYFTVDPKGWTHDHCELCSKTLCADIDTCETSGYVSDNQWLCSSCYNSHINEK